MLYLKYFSVLSTRLSKIIKKDSFLTTTIILLNLKSITASLFLDRLKKDIKICFEIELQNRFFLNRAIDRFHFQQVQRSCFYSNFVEFQYKAVLKQISFIKLQMSEVEQPANTKQQPKAETKQHGKEINQIVQLGGIDISEKLKQYSKLTHEQLLKVTLQLNIQNRRLKNRLAEHQPFKQRVLRPPNQLKVDKLLTESKLKKYALKVCYLGWNYDGMSCQGENDNSVEEYIFKVMHTVSLIPRSFPPDPSFTRAGRTDKGVSAMGNVISLNLRSESDPKKSKIQYCKMINALLPQDIRIIGCEQVPEQFNARYWCTSRRYKYYFAKGSLNIALLQQAIKHFQGTHNFINYCKINVTNTVNFQRTIFSAEVVKAPQQQILENGDDRNQIYYFYYVGNSFLWHQIRFMSSMLFMVGLGTEPPERVKELLSGNQTSRKPNYAMAPDYPLILQDCSYQNLSFENTDPYIIYSFYNNFNRMVHKASMEKVMMVNCMIKARQQLTLSGKISNEVFINAVLELSKKEQANQCKKINKSSSRTLEETINGLKGKKKELYLKKAEKQAAYQQRVRKQKQGQASDFMVNEDQQEELRKQSRKKRKPNEQQGDERQSK